MPKGLTLYMCIGKYAGFGYRVDGPSFRITLGWISFSIGFFDIERACVKVMHRNVRLKKMIEEMRK